MKRNIKGITIIEAVVSIMIAGFVLVGMMRLYSLGAIQSNIARHRVMAINVLQAEIEDLINQGYETLNQKIGQGIYPRTQIVKIDTGKTDDTGDDINGTMVTSIANVSEGYKVTINISWNGYYGVVNEVMTTFITSYL